MRVTQQNLIKFVAIVGVLLGLYGMAHFWHRDQYTAWMNLIFAALSLGLFFRHRGKSLSP